MNKTTETKVCYRCHKQFEFEIDLTSFIEREQMWREWLDDHEGDDDQDRVVVCNDCYEDIE